MMKKKVLTRILILVFIALIIDLGIIGFKIFNYDYDVITEGYIGMVLFPILFVCGVFKLFTERCPHCRKIQVTNGKYCPYCGKEL